MSSTMNILTITPADLHPIMQFCRMEKMALMILGEPGCGKSELTKDYAEKFCNKNLIDLRLTTLQAPDVRGLSIPDMETKKTRFLAPEFLPNSQDPNCPQDGVLFFDEIDRAAPDLQASAMSLLLERRAGDVRLPDGWLVMAAGNGMEFSDQTYEFDPAIADRLVIVRMMADAQAVIDWGTKTGRLDPLVIGFLRTSPDDVSHGKQRREVGKLVGASPRGWERVSKVLFARKDEQEASKLLQAAGKEKDPMKSAELRKEADAAALRGKTKALSITQRQAVISGIIGDDTASRFFLYIEEMDSTVKIDELMTEKDRNKRKQMLPATDKGLYYLAYGLVRLVKDYETAETAIGIINDFDSIAERNDELPIQDIKVTAAEKVFDKIANELKLLSIANSEEYKVYKAARAEVLGGMTLS